MIVLLVWFFYGAPGVLAGPFGPPQPITRGEKGIHTGLGYWFHEGIYRNDFELVRRENQLHSELGYGVADRFEVYGRIGMSGLKISDAFSSTHPATITNKKDFTDAGGYFGTLGAKLFFPLQSNFGVGTFVQGSYYFRSFEDYVSGSRGGVPFGEKVKIQNIWEANFGLSFQTLLAQGIKTYIGPCLQYSEASIRAASNLSDVLLTQGLMTNKAALGGFAGFEVPLTRGFRLNVEGRYLDRLSFGCAVTYSY